MTPSTWVDAYVTALEKSPNATAVQYYDYQNEYFNLVPYIDWYLSFFSTTGAPFQMANAACRFSTTRAPTTQPSVLGSLNTAYGPLLGKRPTDYMDFHYYPSFCPPTPPGVALRQTANTNFGASPMIPFTAKSAPGTRPFSSVNMVRPSMAQRTRTSPTCSPPAKPIRSPFSTRLFGTRWRTTFPFS